MTGIDTIGVRAPVDVLRGEAVRLAPLMTVDRVSGEVLPYSQKVDLGEGFARALLRCPEGAPPTLTVEFSLPRRIVGHNNRPAPQDTLPAALAGVGELVEAQLGLRPDWQKLRVVRLDVARDFSGVVGASSMVRTLGVMPAQDRRIKGNTFGIPPHGVTRKCSGYTLNLYDKAAESAGSRIPAPSGLLRFEAQLRNDALKKFGLLDLDSVLTADLEAVARYYFHRAGYGVSVPEGGGLLALLRDRAPLVAPGDRRTVRDAIGWLVTSAAGAVGVAEVAPRTERKYRHALISNGLFNEHLSWGHSTWRTLDFDRGIIDSSHAAFPGGSNELVS